MLLTNTTWRAHRWANALLSACLLLGAVLVAAPAAVSQGTSGPQWIQLVPGTPEGKPAEFLLDPDQSNEENTAVTISIYGFWQEDVTGDDGQTYQRLSFPGLGTLTQQGAPELPAARFAVGVNNDADSVRFLGSEIVQSQFFSNVRPYPTPIPGEDSEDFDPTWNPGPGDIVGSEEVFTIDPSIYAGGATTPPWPAVMSQDGEVEPMSGPVSGASMSVCPAQWDPGSDRLTVYSQLTVFLSHTGTPNEPLVLTKLKDKLLSKAFVNWDLTKLVFPFDPVEYHSRYLIVCNNVLWFDTLDPFIQHKKSLGFEVTLVASLVDVGAIRAAIASWYGAGDPGMDHYVLLVGDTNLIPLGDVTANGAAVQTDDVYGTVGPINASKEVAVGRITVDSESSLGAQLQKVIDYEVDPVPGGDYHKALLVAHKEEAPGKYTASHTNVLTASYSNPPVFMTSFGYTGGTNQQVMNFVGAGLGVVAYRGHGSTARWSDWNTSNEDFHKNDLVNLVNDETPIVWAITCTNANLDWDMSGGQDSITEVWMEVANGAAASYGATRTTSTTPNHYLNETLFRLVYDYGITTHAHAIELAETLVWLNWPGHKNPWAYLLIGDPSMKIRTEQAEELQFIYPGLIDLDDPISFSGVVTLQGAPPEEGMIAVYKPSFLGGASDEVSGAYWLDEEGFVDLGELGVKTPGTLYITASDAYGNVTQQAVEVGMGAAWEDRGQSLAGANGAPLLAGVGLLAANTTWDILLSNATPGANAYFCLGFSELSLPFKGGVLVPDVTPGNGLYVPIPVDANGNIVISSVWPTGIPASTQIFLQYWIPDDTGPVGFVASNAVVGTAQ